MGLKILKRKRLFDVAWWGLLWPVYLFLKLLPRDQRLTVFGSSLGWHFSDNSKYFFLYASRHAENSELVFVSKETKVVEEIRGRGLRAEYLYSLRGVTTVLRAGRAFVSHSAEDIHPVFLSGAEIIQLWHGTPIRKIVHDCDWQPLDSSRFSLKIRLKTGLLRLIWRVVPYTHVQDNFDRIMVSSEAIIPSFKTAFRMNEEKAVVAGQPRNDCLTGEVRFDEKFFPELEHLEKLRREAGILVAWLPTHRAQAGAGIVDFLTGFGFDENALERICARYNLKIVVKPHFLVKDKVENKLAGKKYFELYEPVDPYPLLNRTDILITDYSSVYLDFLLLNRPVLFAAFDYEEYIKHSAELYYDYNEVTPGPKCANWPSLVIALEEAAAAVRGERADQWQQQRAQVKRRFNTYDSGFCERLLKEFPL